MWRFDERTIGSNSWAPADKNAALASLPLKAKSQLIFSDFSTINGDLFACLLFRHGSKRGRAVYFPDARNRCTTGVRRQCGGECRTVLSCRRIESGRGTTQCWL